MRNFRTGLMSFLIILLFMSGMIISVSAEGEDEPDESSISADVSSDIISDEQSIYSDSSDEESSDEESSIAGSSDEESSYAESSDEESSYAESSDEESSYAESSDEESSYAESSDEESSYAESSDEESSDEESSETESSDDISGTESSNEESSREESGASEPSEESSDTESSGIVIRPKPDNDPLRWMAAIRVILPADRNNDGISSDVSYMENYSLPPAVPEEDNEKFTDLSGVPAEPMNETPAAVTDIPKNNTVQFLVGIIIFSFLGIVLTLTVILMLRARGDFTPSFLKFENKKIKRKQ